MIFMPDSRTLSEKQTTRVNRSSRFAFPGRIIFKSTKPGA